VNMYTVNEKGKSSTQQQEPKNGKRDMEIRGTDRGTGKLVQKKKRSCKSKKGTRILGVTKGKNRRKSSRWKKHQGENTIFREFLRSHAKL